MFNLFKKKTTPDQVEKKLQSQVLLRNKVAVTLIELETALEWDMIEDLVELIAIVGEGRLNHGSFLCGAYNIVIDNNKINVIKMTS